MSGALYCTAHLHELAAFFVPDRESLTYRDADELVDRVRYALDHLAAAAAIRGAAWQDHTWERRFEQLFLAVGLSREATVHE